MRKYLCIHTLPAGVFTWENICQLAEAAQHDPNVRGYRSFVNVTEGNACCILEAHDRESLAAWFRKMKVPYDDIVEVEFEGECGVVQDLREQPAVAGTA